MTIGIELLLLLVNLGVFAWIVKVEVRLKAIETTCQLRNENGKRCTDAAV